MVFVDVVDVDNSDLCRLIGLVAEIEVEVDSDNADD